MGLQYKTSVHRCRNPWPQIPWWIRRNRCFLTAHGEHDEKPGNFPGNTMEVIQLFTREIVVLVWLIIS